MRYVKPNIFYYKIAQAVSWLVATFIFKRKIVRNEIKNKKGPFVVIANHQAALDFVNLIGARKRPMSFVISNSFYNTLPIKGFLNKMGVIPKQQFQTSAKELKRIKAVIDNGEAVVIYPAGLMCEDGLSTPIPTATYKFLKWLEADVYAAKTDGTYFVMPKWAKGMRAGRTYMDIYKLFSKEELKDTDIDEIRQSTENALLFDAYREQEKHLIKYKNNDNIEGLENVLYQCPNCKAEFSMCVKNENTIYCSECGFYEVSDEYAFLHNHSGIGEEIRYVSDWSRFIYDDLKESIKQEVISKLCAKTSIHMIDYNKNKFVEVGFGTITLSKENFVINGEINGKTVNLSVSIANMPSLPFSPGKYLELQQANNIYRCVLDDGKLVMKFINMLKIFHEMKNAEEERKVLKTV